MSMFFFRTKKRRIKRLSLSLDRAGNIKVTAPPDFPQAKIDEFIRQHTGWISKQRTAYKKYTHLPEGTGTKRHYAAHKEDARKFITSRVEFWNCRLGFSYTKIAIRNQVSRWGSCSKKGILNFNYRLLMLPLELADYVVVHELCHLKHFNHSKRFWDEVEIVLPEYDKHLKVLKTYRMS